MPRHRAPDLGRAVAHQKLGDIFRQVGRNEEAHQAICIRAELAHATCLPEAPQDPAIRDCLARSHAGLGELCLNADRTKEAVEHFRQAVLLAEKSASDNPDQAQARASLLEAYFRLGPSLRLRPRPGFRARRGSARWKASPSSGSRTSQRTFWPETSSRPATARSPICGSSTGDDVAARRRIREGRRSGPRAASGRAGQFGREAASGAGTRRPGDDAVAARPA